ncbi:type II secretion system secretin GspD [Salinivibrio sp. YCSC6]|uniref:type II secretion system secretin GspD n=1 Tax=Salinivibrio sp. YCSC6 TaxID=2003370 RepID=UPI000BBBF4C1|nr:type II secretion system secretin GspD [Salinivibrio sp. YCSC6]PCE69388.1 type II secretion system protein GspD [Salinivibrio sp. YCSC6]QCF37155.1 type II secretion system protein GspD [Salinivibrio sp. YCSC6]
MAASLLFSGIPAGAAEFSASFKGTDIQEFIEIVGRNLEKTIIVDPSVRGTINVRSYDTLTDEQYYQFFLNVLEVYGFAVVEMENGVVKVVRDKDAKTSPVPVVGEDDSVVGDEVVTRVVAVKNVSVRELSPLLRQLINNAGAGNVVHYDPANVIMITGRAAVVNRLTDIIRRVDQAGDKEVEVVRLDHASAAEMVRIVEALNERDNANNAPDLLKPRFVADERLNAVLISGEPKVRERVKKLIRQLDQEMATTGNSRVIYLRYAKAEDVVDVLQGVSDNLLKEKEEKSKPGAQKQAVQISSHQGTNSLVITAPPDILKTLESVISQLDIRRAQVLIEALIVEMSESDGANLGIQWGSLENGGIQFTNTGVGVSSYLGGLEATKDRTRTETRIIDGEEKTVEIKESGDYSALNEVLGGLNGIAAGVIMGDWTALVTAVASNNESNILSSPNLMVLDNQEASFIVGEEVPVITGSRTGSNNDNPFQTVERKDVGIKLKVTPQINEGSAVLLDIEQEVSNVLGASGAVDVRFGKRQLNTSVMVGDQQMIVLSGLIDERTVESESKVPLLGDIPVLGHLFKSTSTGTEKKNLMLFIKPTIIRTGLTADGVTQRKYNYIRAEQLLRAQDGVKLMPDAKKPVLPDYKSDAVMPAEVRALQAELAG